MEEATETMKHYNLTLFIPIISIIIKILSLFYVYVFFFVLKGLKNQVQVKMNIVSCPPVTTVLIKRPDLKYQLGFSVQNGIVSTV